MRPRCIEDASEMRPRRGLPLRSCTSFASVYFEKMLKGASNPSLWLRNVQVQCCCCELFYWSSQPFPRSLLSQPDSLLLSQLASYSSLIAAAALFVEHGPPSTWFSGFDSRLTWVSIVWQAR